MQSLRRRSTRQRLSSGFFCEWQFGQWPAE